LVPSKSKFSSYVKTVDAEASYILVVLGVGISGAGEDGRYQERLDRHEAEEDDGIGRSRSLSRRAWRARKNETVERWKLLILPWLLLSSLGQHRQAPPSWPAILPHEQSCSGPARAEQVGIAGLGLWEPTWSWGGNKPAKMQHWGTHEGSPIAKLLKLLPMK
jgi:hypothetical protein